MIQFEECASVVEKLRLGKRHIHIAGEPGIGKSTLLEQVKPELREEFNIAHFVVNHPALSGDAVITRTMEKILDNGDIDLDESKIAGGGINTPLGGSQGSRQIDFHNPTQTRANELEEVAREYDSRPLIIVIDDIHEIYESPKEARAVIKTIRENLSQNIQLLTAGQIDFESANQEVTLSGFDGDKTRHFLKSQLDSSEEVDFDKVHENTDGHPGVLHKLVNSGINNKEIEIISGKTRKYIYNKYFDSLAPQHERFLKAAAHLEEIDAETCKSCLKMDLDEVEIQDTLTALRSKKIITPVGVSFNNSPAFKLNQAARNVLVDRESENKSEKIHRSAFQFYLSKLFEAAEEDSFKDIITASLMARSHLVSIYDGVNADELTEEIEKFRRDFDEFDNWKEQLIFEIKAFTLVRQEFDSELMTFVDGKIEFAADHISDKYDLDREEKKLLNFVQRFSKSFARVFLKDESNVSEDDLEKFEILLEKFKGRKTDISKVFDVRGIDWDAQQMGTAISLLGHGLLYYYYSSDRWKDEEQSEKQYNLTLEGLEELGLQKNTSERLNKRIQELLDELELEEKLQSLLDEIKADMEEQIEESKTLRSGTYSALSHLEDAHRRYSEEIGSILMINSTQLREFVVDIGEILSDSGNKTAAAVWYVSIIDRAEYVASNYRDGHPFRLMLDEIIENLSEKLDGLDIDKEEIEFARRKKDRHLGTIDQNLPPRK